MPRRSIWSARQRAALFDLPTDEAALLRHYTLSDDDIEQIRARRGGHNRLGFALQLCAFRYPGRILVVEEAIPLQMPLSVALTAWLRTEVGANFLLLLLRVGSQSRVSFDYEGVDDFLPLGCKPDRVSFKTRFNQPIG